MRPSSTALIAGSASGLNLDEPLGRQVGLDDSFAAITFADGHLVVFGFFKESAARSGVLPTFGRALGTGRPRAASRRPRFDSGLSASQRHRAARA